MSLNRISTKIYLFGYESYLTLTDFKLVLPVRICMYTEVQKIVLPSGLDLSVLRLDLIHPLYGGNKYYKLKYNLPDDNDTVVLTFGGAHSNHIYSTAAYCYEKGIRAVAIIRGEDSAEHDSPTLQFARSKGMILHFVSRSDYKEKENSARIRELINMYPKVRVVPEGGSNAEGIRGCTEILNGVSTAYGYVFCACGTAATFTGLLASLQKQQIAIGISVLKGENHLLEAVNRYCQSYAFSPIGIAGNILDKSTILDMYHFGGYARSTPELLAFKKDVEDKCELPLDYVYTVKVLFAIDDLYKKGRLLPDRKLLMVHTGGTQGNVGYEARLRAAGTPF